MTLQEAMNKLATLRKRQSRIQKEIMQLRDFIVSKGGNPYPYGQPEILKRNKAIYHLRRKGLLFKEIASQYNFSAPRVQGIYHLIEAIIQHKRGNYQYYLLK